MKYVVIRDMSAGNAETGEAWQETRIFNGSATLKEVMSWAEGYRPGSHSSKRIQITRPYQEDHPNG